MQWQLEPGSRPTCACRVLPAQDPLREERPSPALLPLANRAPALCIFAAENFQAPALGAVREDPTIFEPQSMDRGPGRMIS